MPITWSCQEQVGWVHHSLGVFRRETSRFPRSALDTHINVLEYTHYSTNQSPPPSHHQNMSFMRHTDSLTTSSIILHSPLVAMPLLPFYNTPAHQSQLCHLVIAEISSCPGYIVSWTTLRSTVQDIDICEDPSTSLSSTNNARSLEIPGPIQEQPRDILSTRKLRSRHSTLIRI